ncbi:MAG: hypothetical protein V3V21_07175 [Thermoplasmata archaeon]
MDPGVASNSAPKPLESRSRRASQAQMTSHTIQIRRARKARKRVPIRRAFIETSEIEDQSRVREETPKREVIVSKAETEVTYNENEGSQPSPENRIIKTSSLRRFASEKLPSSSVLREVLMAENEKLTAEEFLAKLDIWLHLFKRDIGG